MCGREGRAHVPSSGRGLKTTTVSDTVKRQRPMRRLLQTGYLALQLLHALRAQRRADGCDSHARVLQRRGKLTNGIMGDNGSESI